LSYSLQLEIQRGEETGCAIIRGQQKLLERLRKSGRFTEWLNLDRIHDYLSRGYALTDLNRDIFALSPLMEFESWFDEFLGLRVVDETNVRPDTASEVAVALADVPDGFSVLFKDKVPVRASWLAIDIHARRLLKIGLTLLIGMLEVPRSPDSQLDRTGVLDYIYEHLNQMLQITDSHETTP
jgi:hypothetical protein